MVYEKDFHRYVFKMFRRLDSLLGLCSSHERAVVHLGAAAASHKELDCLCFCNSFSFFSPFSKSW